MPLASTTCGGTPAVSATPGGGSFAASGLTIPAAGNCKVQVISVGTGKAMELGKNGDVDVVPSPKIHE